MEADAMAVPRCTLCGGRGFLREDSFFFYGICLLACGALALFQWTSPELFVYSWRLVEIVHGPTAVGTAIIVLLISLAPVLGAASLFAWRRYGMCPECGTWPR